jgi:hypothetical protein
MLVGTLAMLQLVGYASHRYLMIEDDHRGDNFTSNNSACNAVVVETHMPGMQRHVQRLGFLFPRNTHVLTNQAY